MKHYIQFTIACLLLLTCPTATMAEQEKKQNYIYLSGETKKIYKLHDVITGTAAWYGERLHGNKTSSGERFDCNKLTAAHRSLPFGTILIVTNLNNKRKVKVRITDRGPLSTRFVIDLSKGAARKLNMVKAGIAPVTLQIDKLPDWYIKKFPYKK